MANIAKKGSFAIYDSEALRERAIQALEKGLEANEALSKTSLDANKTYELNKIGLKLLKDKKNLNKLNELWRD